MKLPIFASFIVFGIWLTYELRKHKKIESTGTIDYFEKERLANETRKKTLTNLNYITIPAEQISSLPSINNEVYTETLKTYKDLSNKTIVNLTGFTNTDLKLMYGTANLTILSEFDQNYTLLARTLQKLALLLYKEKETKSAQLLLEFALSTDTDISASYKLLATIYLEQNNPEKIEDLIQRAGTLKSLSQKAIVRSLKELDLCID